MVTTPPLFLIYKGMVVLACFIANIKFFVLTCAMPFLLL